MAQQKSEDRVVPDGGVMPAQPIEQGKAVPVEQTVVQLQLPIATAEDPQGSAREAVRDRSRAGRAGVPKAIVTEGKSTLAMMEEVVARIDLAMKKVVANKGAPGPDGMTVSQLRERWPTIAPRLRAGLLAGTYRPGGIRRALIPKVGGGQRGLGIPTVTSYREVDQTRFGFVGGHASVSSAPRRAA
jgi:RNA-directed DNA polymerase